MPLEDELSDAMYTAVSGLDPATADLVAGGAARGRAIQRRRKARVLGTTGVVATVAVGVAFGVSGAMGGSGTGPGGDLVPVLAGPSPGGSASPGSRVGTPGNQITNTAKGVVSMGPAPAEGKIFNALKEILPAGYTVSLVAGEPGYVQVSATDSQGTVTIEVNVEPGGAAMPGLYPCSALHVGGNLVVTDPVHCTDLAAGAGAHLLTTTETDPAAQGALYYWTADYGRADKVRIAVAEINSLNDKGSQGPSRTTQAFSTTQLADMAGSPLWPTS